MVVIDSDSHVGESTAMFDLLDEEYHSRRPQPVALDKDSGYSPFNAAWVIDGKLYPAAVGKGGTLLLTPTFMELNRTSPCSIPSMELTDVDARLRDLDRMGIDTQIIYPSLFLVATAEDVKFEAALMRCYNTFMADATAKSSGRLGFAALVPLRDIEESIKELRRARSMGAAAVMLHGVIWNMGLGDKALYPFYEEAQNLEIPVVVHFGWGSPAITNLFYATESFNSATIPVVMGCYSLMTSGVLDTFPQLKVAFLESSSSWVPWLIHQLRRRVSTGRSGNWAKDPAEYFKEGRAYIACEADEDINYLASLVGEDAILGASDYPHPDPSAEFGLVEVIMGREDLPLRVKEKILYDNPAKLYGL